MYTNPILNFTEIQLPINSQIQLPINSQIQLSIEHKSNCQLYKQPVIERMLQTAVNIFLVSLMISLVVGDTHLQLDDDYDKNLLPPRFFFF